MSIIHYNLADAWDISMNKACEENALSITRLLQYLFLTEIACEIPYITKDVGKMAGKYAVEIVGNLKYQKV